MLNNRGRTLVGPLLCPYGNLVNKSNGGWHRGMWSAKDNWTRQLNYHPEAVCCLWKVSYSSGGRTEGKNWRPIGLNSAPKNWRADWWNVGEAQMEEEGGKFTVMPEEAIQLLLEEDQREVVRLGVTSALIQLAVRYEGEAKDDLMNKLIEFLPRIADEDILAQPRLTSELMGILGKAGKLAEAFMLLEKLLSLNKMPSEKTLLLLLKETTERRLVEPALNLFQFLSSNFEDFLNQPLLLENHLIPLLRLCMRERNKKGILAIMRFVTEATERHSIEGLREYDDDYEAKPGGLRTRALKQPKDFVFLLDIVGRFLDPPSVRLKKILALEGVEYSESKATGQGRENEKEEEKEEKEEGKEKNEEEEAWTNDELFELFEYLSEGEVNCDYGFYKLLQAYADYGDLEKVNKILERVEPNFVTYQVLAQLTLCQQGDVEKAYEFLMKACEDLEARKASGGLEDSQSGSSGMMTSSSGANTTHYNNANVPRVADWQLFEDFIQKGASGIIFGLSHLLNVYVETKHSSQSFDPDYLAQMVSKLEEAIQMPIDQILYSVLMKAYLKKRNVEAALALLELAVSRSEKTEEIIFHPFYTVISWLVREDQSRDVKLIRQLSRRVAVNIRERPDWQKMVRECLLEMWINRGDIGQAFEVLGGLKKHSKVQRHLYERLFELCKKLGDADRARELQFQLGWKGRQVWLDEKELRQTNSRTSMLDFLRKGMGDKEENVQK